MTFIKIKNWEKFQHYKERNPPWIKLHRELMTSETWVSLDDAGRVLAIAIMMLAAATGNKIRADKSYLKRVAYLNQEPDISPLLELGFIEIIDENGEVASTMLADASKLQADARPETEQSRAETEHKEPETEKICFDFSTGKFSGITDEKQSLWRNAYPALDLKIEINKAAAWLLENPKNKKSNYGKFLNGWFCRGQDRAPKQGQPTRRMPSPAGG